MEYNELSKKILNAVGGADNVKTVTHCITRLRISCHDPSLIAKDKIKGFEGVQGLVDRGYEIQIVIGTDVINAYNAFTKLVDHSRKVSGTETEMPAPAGNTAPTSETAAPEKAKHRRFRPLDIFLKYVGGSVIYTFPILCCAAGVNVICMILTTFLGVSAESGTYKVFYTLYQAFFDFMPIFIGFGAAKILGINQLYGAFLGAFLVHANINGAEGLDLFGIPILSASYGSTVFPVLLGTAFMALADRHIGSKIPQAVSFILRPFVVFVISIPVTLWLLAPLGAFIGIYVADGIQWLHSHLGLPAIVIMRFISPILTATGTGNALLPIFMQSYLANGYESFMFPASLGKNIALGGAALAVAVKTKSRLHRQQSLSSGLTALCGISEPAIFGITLPFKKPFIAALIGSACGGIVSGIFDVKMFSINPPGLITLPLFMNPDGSFHNLIGALLVVVVSFTVSFALTCILGSDDTAESEYSTALNEKGERS